MQENKTCSRRNYLDKIDKLMAYLKQYNTYWVTYKGNKYLCLELTPSNNDLIGTKHISFKLGRFNDSGIWLNSSNGCDYLDFDVTYANNADTIIIYREDGVIIKIECINDSCHTINNNWFDGDFNFFKPEYTDEQRSYQNGDLYYCVVDMYKLGEFKNREDEEYLRDLFGCFENSKRTLTICYVCNLKTKQVTDMGVYDLVNKKVVGILKYA